MLPHIAGMSAPAVPPEPVLFDATLHPHRSLSPAGFRVLMAVLAGTFLAIGAIFYLAGAWPVVGFCGLELALVYMCFRLNFRDLRRYETIRLTERELELCRVAPDGSAERLAFQPYWLRVRLEDRIGRSSRLVLSSHGREAAVGSFLSPEEREQLARALNEALARQRLAPGA